LRNFANCLLTFSFAGLTKINHLLTANQNGFDDERSEKRIESEQEQNGTYDLRTVFSF